MTETAPTVRSVAIVPTASASRYLQQLCKHWSHKFSVTFDAQAGQVPLPLGDVTLNAGADALTVACTAPDPEGLVRMQQVVATHLERFAFREGELVFDWRPG